MSCYIMNHIQVFRLAFLVVVATISVGYVHSFISIGNLYRSRTTLHMAKRMDIAEIIKTALTTSNKFGVASYKATLAWKSIEEIEYAQDINEKVASTEQFKNDTTLRIEEYDEMLHELKPMLEKQEVKTEKMKSLAKEIKNVKETRDNKRTNSLREAITFARKATKKFGLNSTESAVAWETFDRIAEEEQLQLQPMTEIECLLDDIDKCLALEELQQSLEK